MTPLTTVQDVIDELARDPLCHIVLLKQLLAYPEHVKVHRVCGPEGAATLVALDTSVSPRGVGIVFKLSSEADLAPVESQFPVTRRTAFVSFTSAGGIEPAAGVHITSAPGDAAFQMFETQGHDRAWLKALLRSGKAFACVAGRGGDTVSACLAFENYGPVWEVGGVVTVPSHHRQGLGTLVVRTALAELVQRGLAPRYQVEESNTASIALARSVGLAPFLTIVHYAHAC